jgi:hypothetical protein
MKINKLIIFAFVLSLVGCANTSFASEVTGNLSTGLTSSVNETLTGTVVAPSIVIPTNTGGGSSGGGGGGRSFVPAPVSNPAMVSTSTLTTTAELQVLIAQLTNQLNALLAKKGEVLGVSTYKFVKTLKKGITSDDIKELQNRLMTEKFLMLPASTRFFGNATFDAVKKYQTAHKLPSTGFVGPLTIAELNK